MKRSFRVVALLVLVVSLMMPSVVLADLVLPPGTGVTNLVTQNISEGDAAVTIAYYDVDGNVDYNEPSTTIKPLAVKEFKTGDIPSTSLPDGWVGSAVMSSDAEVGVIVSVRWTATGREDGSTQDAYVGGMQGFNQLYLPDLKRVPLTGDPTKANQVSKIYVQNTESAQATIYMNYYNRQGGFEGVKVATIPGYSQKSFDLRKDADIPAGVADGFGTTNDGACYITSTNKIYAIVQTTWQNWDAAYEGLGQADTTLYAPSAFRTKRADGSWNIYSAVVVQNTTGASADIHFNYINRSTGNTDLHLVRTVGAYAATGLNTRTGGDLPASTFEVLGDNWAGSVIVTSTANIVGSSNIFWAASTQNYAGAYVMKSPSQAGEKIFIPAYYRRIDSKGWSQWSAINLLNTENVSRVINIRFIDGTGATVLAVDNFTLGPNAGIGINSRNGSGGVAGLPTDTELATALGDSFIGGAYIEAPAGSKLIATVNIIYRDRSSVYNTFSK
ncbi:MAG TPA: hypothetical protein PLJ78_10580 [Anaerolineae bacterium]|nr:hypothetical protein [Anaerolineae bacterium]HQK14373.1 hypothetical protein [Anaerolineae bacterium]